MGGAVSSGASNSELVDNLCSEAYITQPDVERVFRMIDRADYMTFTDDGDRIEAYEDHAWRKGTVHISAPCIYTKAMEALELREGMSFLNIGSGTGYLSTMVGLLLGATGINHGVELQQDNVDYAMEKLLHFKEHSQWYDPLTFCDPTFLVGNGLLMSPGTDSNSWIYCGAACPTEHIDLMKSLLKVGGILVFPVDNKLESMSRVGESEWVCKVVLPSVSFASLVTPSPDDLKRLPLVEFKLEPSLLKDLCRMTILRHVTRSQYTLLSSLPLPKHLQEYIAHYREWTPPPLPFPLKCDQPSEAASKPSHDPMADTVSINGRRVLLCSFNGVVFQLPLEAAESSDEDDSNEPAAPVEEEPPDMDASQSDSSKDSQ